MSSTATLQAQPGIDSHYPLTADQIAAFRRDGFVKLKHVLSAEVLAHYGDIITAEVKRLNTMHLPIEKRDTYNKAFLQVGNIWTHNETVKEFCMSRRLARIAAELMGVKGVRMYHDQALYKEAGGGITPWHADQFYWPFAGDNCVTVWIPLQETPAELGPLAFGVGSHRSKVGRDITISDESEARIGRSMREQNFTPDRPFLQPNQYKASAYPVWKLLGELHRAGQLTPAQEFLCAPHMPAEELYDLEMDPDETVNLASSPQHNAVLKRLRAALENWIKATHDKGGELAPP